MLLIDDRTGRQRKVSEPGCGGFTLTGLPWLLGRCSSSPSEIALYNVFSGKLKELAVSPEVSAGELAIPQAAGSKWIEFDRTCDRDCGNTYVFQNIATGQVRSLPAWKAGGTVIPDLNSATLAKKLCSPVRVPSGFKSPDYPMRPPGTVSVYGRYVVATSWSGPRGYPNAKHVGYIERCSSRMRISTGIPASNSHMVVWTPARTNQRFAGVLLPSLRRLAFTLPHKIAGATMYALDSYRLYVEDADGRVWVARIPTQA